MTIRYEINPPKILDDVQSDDDLLVKTNQRVADIVNDCDGIHVTDNVLGTTRVSPLKAGTTLRSKYQNLKITTSLRVIERDFDSVTKLVDVSASLKLNGTLIVKGDPAPNGIDSGLVPSQVVKRLNELGVGKKIDLYLSLPGNPNFDKIQRKVDAEPKGFITQVIHSVEQVTRMVDKLKPQGFEIIPCLLLPSKNNSKSAEFLNLDWSTYQDNVIGFIKSIHDLTGDVLITSPNDFASAKDSLSKLDL